MGKRGPPLANAIFLFFSFFLPLTFLPEGVCLRFRIRACLSKYQNKSDLAPKNGGPPLHPPNSHFRAESRQSACTMGKRGPPLSNAIFTLVINFNFVILD